LSQVLHDEERRQFERLIRQERLNRVGDRMAVLEAFLASEEHHAAQGWHLMLKEQGKDLGPEFVGETLEMLVRYGLAMRREFEGGPPRYEHRHLGEHHDHMICTACGGITEFHDPELEELKERAAASHGFHSLRHRLQIYGLCEGCRGSRQPAMPLAMASPGERLKVASVQGGCQAAQQLKEMGLLPGVELEVISANGGPMVVAVGGSRLALGRGVAHRVLVNPSPPRPAPNS